MAAIWLRDFFSNLISLKIQNDVPEVMSIILKISENIDNYRNRISELRHRYIDISEAKVPLSKILKSVSDLNIKRAKK